MARTLLIFFVLCQSACCAPAPRDRVADLIEQLGARRFRAREAAQKALKEMGEAIRSRLERALPRTKDREVKRRLELLISVLDEKKRQRLLALEASAEVRAVGYYTANSNKGVAEVRVGETSKPLILVLCAYDSVEWKVKAAPGSKLIKVIVGGYQSQAVSGTKVAVERYCYQDRNGSRSRKWFYAYRESTSSYRRMNQKVKAITGKSISRFVGRYSCSKEPVRIGQVK